VLDKTEEYSDCAIFILTLNVDETCGGCLCLLISAFWSILQKLNISCFSLFVTLYFQHE